MNYATPGAGVPKVSEDEKKRFSFTKFFVLFVRKFWKLVSANLMYVFVNLPIFAGILALSGNFNVPFETPARQFYPILYGVSKYGMNPALAALFGLNGQIVTSGYPSTVTKVLYGVAAITVLTLGLSNVGMAYITRNYAREDPADGEDFFHAIKRNWKQGLILGVLDAICILVLIYDVTYFYYLAFYYEPDGFVWQMIFFAMVILSVLYAMMRMYMYILAVTFDLKITKLIKNCFILAILGIKRNVVALAGIALTVFINYLFYVFLTPVGIALPFILTFSMTAFMSAYAAYPNVKRYMIDPFYTSEKPSYETDEEPIFQDRG